MSQPVLYIFSGLPASVKTTLSPLLAVRLGNTHLRIDTIEQGLRDLAQFEPEGKGYRLAYRIARDNLNLGQSLIADSCNPIALTRREWEQVAIEAGAASVNIEVICSDAKIHSERAETRDVDIPDIVLPDWLATQERHYEAWSVPRIVIDTADQNVEASFEMLLAGLKNRSAGNSKQTDRDCTRSQTSNTLRFALFASMPQVLVMHGDWRDDFLSMAPFDLLFADGGGIGSSGETRWQQVADLVRPGGMLVIDVLTQESLWPDEWRGQSDPKRELAFNSGWFISCEVRTTDETSAFLMVRRAGRPDVQL
jgi:predicted kinase